MTNIDELKEEVKGLLHLLEDPHPGLMTWQQMVHNRIKKIAVFG